MVAFLVQQRIRRIVISTGFNGEAIKRHFNSCSTRSTLGADLTFAKEHAPLGTAGGFRNAVQSVVGLNKSPRFWLVMNGDSLVASSLSGLFQSTAASAADAALMVLHSEDTARYGRVMCDENGYVREFCEKRGGPGLVSSGIYLLGEHLIELFPERLPLSFELDVFPELLRRGTKLFAVVCEAPFLDIGTPETLPKAEEFVRCSLGYLV